MKENKNELKEEDVSKISGGEWGVYEGVDIEFSHVVPGSVHCPNCGYGWGYLTMSPSQKNIFKTNIMHCSNCDNIWDQKCF